MSTQTNHDNDWSTWHIAYYAGLNRAWGLAHVVSWWRLQLENSKL